MLILMSSWIKFLRESIHWICTIVQTLRRKFVNFSSQKPTWFQLQIPLNRGFCLTLSFKHTHYFSSHFERTYTVWWKKNLDFKKLVIFFSDFGRKLRASGSTRINLDPTQNLFGMKTTSDRLSNFNHWTLISYFEIDSFLDWISFCDQKRHCFTRRDKQML